MNEILERIVETFWDAKSQLKALEKYYKQIGLI